MVGRRSARAGAATSTATASKIKTSWRLLWIKPNLSPQRHRGTEKPEDTQACQKHPSPLDSFSAYHKPLVFLCVSVSQGIPSLPFRTYLCGATAVLGIEKTQLERQALVYLPTMRPQPTSAEHLLALARQVLHLEADALRTTSSRLDAGFADAVHLILACSGRAVASGMGKSGHIGGKSAATPAPPRPPG